MQMSRATGLFVMSLLLVTAVVYVVNENAAADHSVVREADMDLVLADLDAANGSKTLKSCVELKAFCLSSYDKAYRMKEGSGHSAGPIIDFITLFGKAPKKGSKINVVLDYAAALGEAKKTYSAGIGGYILAAMNKAVVDGKSLLTLIKVGGKNLMTMDRKALGLSVMPQYFQKAAAPLAQYSTLLIKVKSDSKSADAQAAAMWLKSGAKAEYHSFLKKEILKVKGEKMAYAAKITAAAAKGIKASFAATKKLPPMPPAGTKAATTARADNPKVWPNYKQITADAKIAAKKWEKFHDDIIADADAEALKVEDKAAGSGKKPVAASSLAALYEDLE